MTRYLLDTNIISEITRPTPSPEVASWLEAQTDAELFIASLTVAELGWGILELPAGRKRATLEQWFAGPDGPQSLFRGRVLPFDTAAGLIWARLMAAGRAAGRQRSSLDMIIASIAEANSCVVVTLNARDFTGLGALNPMRAGETT